MKKLILSLLISLTPVISMASSNSLTMSAASIALVAEKFEQEFPEALKTFSGVRAWPDQNMIMVKVYSQNNTKSVQYHCHMSGEQLQCLKM